jgi:hypothetical protein
MRQTFCCYFFLHSAKSFTLRSTSYHIWSCDKLFAVIFSLIQLKVFLSFNFIYNMKLRQTFCCYFFLYSAKSFSFIQLHIIYEVWQTFCCYFFLYSAKSFSFIQLHIIYEVWQSICFFFFSYSAKSLSFAWTSYHMWRFDSLFDYSFYYIQLFLLPFV